MRFRLSCGHLLLSSELSTSPGRQGWRATRCRPCKWGNCSSLWVFACFHLWKVFFSFTRTLCVVFCQHILLPGVRRDEGQFFCLSGFFLFRTLWLSYQHPSVLFCRICTSPDTFHSPFCCWQQSHHCSVGVFVWSNPPRNKNPANFETTLQTGMGVETVVNQTEKGRITFFSPFFLQQKSIITQTTWSSKHPVWTE